MLILDVGQFGAGIDSDIRKFIYEGPWNSGSNDALEEGQDEQGLVVDEMDTVQTMQQGLALPNGWMAPLPPAWTGDAPPTPGPPPVPPVPPIPTVPQIPGTVVLPQLQQQPSFPRAQRLRLNLTALSQKYNVRISVSW